jgi:hypothetical protein
MELVIGIVVAVVVLAAVALLVGGMFSRGSTPPPTREEPPAGTVTVVLEVTTDDPEAPGVQRLVSEIAARTFATQAAVEEVVVVNATGTELARVQRHADVAPTPAMPESLSEPHHVRSRAPDPVRGGGAPRPRPMDVDEPLDLRERPFADRLDLAPEIRELVTDPTDPVDVIRAILTAAGTPVEVSSDLVRSGDDAIVVVGEDGSRTVSPDELTRAFLRYQQSGARRGIVICLGFVRPDELHRRELLAPTLRHAGAEAIQRMADAAALGADPLQFAAGAPMR